MNIMHKMKVNAKLYEIIVFLAPSTYQCPSSFPILERHSSEKDHGDVCRKTKGDKAYECPDGCSKVEKSPWCEDTSSNDPCRVPIGKFVPYIMYMTSQ